MTRDRLEASTTRRSPVGHREMTSSGSRRSMSKSTRLRNSERSQPRGVLVSGGFDRWRSCMTDAVAKAGWQS